MDGGKVTDNGFWVNRIVETGAADPQELAKGFNPLNWRGHPESQREALEEALDSIGILQRVLVNKTTGRLIDGHLRVELAVLKGQPLIPVDYVELTDDEEALALATLDAITEQAQPIADKLAALLERTREMTAERPGLKAMLEALKVRAGVNGVGNDNGQDVEPKIDKAAELQKVWNTESGQVWQLGNHRLAVGDCTDRAVVEAVMRGERARLVVTDPPYGVSYADKNKFLNAISPANRIETPIENDHATKEQTQAMWKAAFCEMSAIMDAGAVVYCFMPQGGDQMMMMMMMMMGAGIEPRHELIWLKNNHVLGRVDYAYKHEPILYAWKEGGHKFYGDFQTSILEYPKPQISDLHPTQKPVALIERLISNSSLPEEAVYDPFVGSGTTIIAGENLGRKVRAIELDPGYAAVSIQRWVDLTGREPRLLTG